MRASAGTMSPARTRMTSPGTNSRAGGVIHFPSRLTRALIASLAFKAAMALPAWRSSQNPTIALETSRTRMMKKSGQCRAAADRITAASIIHGIGPQKYVRNFRNGLTFFSSISFGPYSVSRFRASAWLRPSGDDAKRVLHLRQREGLQLVRCVGHRSRLRDVSHELVGVGAHDRDRRFIANVLPSKGIRR